MPSAEEAFLPVGNTILITGTSVASLPVAPSSAGGMQGMRMVNISTDRGWLAIGRTTATAAVPSTVAGATGFPIERSGLPGSVLVVSTPPGCFVSAITTAAAAVCTIALTPGIGLG